MKEFLSSIIGMVLEGENASTLKEPCPIIAWSTTNSHELLQDWTQTWAMSGRRLTAGIMAPTIRSRLPRFHMLSICYCSHSMQYNWLYTYVYKTYAG